MKIQNMPKTQSRREARTTLTHTEENSEQQRTKKAITFSKFVKLWHPSNTWPSRKLPLIKDSTLFTEGDFTSLTTTYPTRLTFTMMWKERRTCICWDSTLRLKIQQPKFQTSWRLSRTWRRTRTTTWERLPENVDFIVGNYHILLILSNSLIHRLFLGDLTIYRNFDSI